MTIIKSSEIASYLFCPVSWWIGITKGVKITKAMKRGEKFHKTVAENQPIAKIIYACMIILLIIAISLILFKAIRWMQ